MLRNGMLRAAGSGFDYESPYGAPTATVTTFPSLRAGLSSNNQDFCMALDTEFTTLSDRGLIMEAGAGRGISWGVYGDGTTVRMRARGYNGNGTWSTTTTGAAKVEVVITPYIGRFNTFYLTGDTSAGNIKLWVQPGGKGSTSNLVFLGTGLSGDSNTNVYGNAGGGYGTFQGNFPDLTNFVAGTYRAPYPTPSTATWYKEVRERTRQGNGIGGTFGNTFDRV